MLGYILKRLLLAIPTLFAVLSDRLRAGARAAGRSGADDPRRSGERRRRSPTCATAWASTSRSASQYVDFLVNAVRGDWGNSLVTGKPVVEEVRKVLPYTIDLTVTAIVLGALIGIPLGVWSALRRNTWVDYVARIGSLARPFVSRRSSRRSCCCSSLPSSCAGSR